MFFLQPNQIRLLNSFNPLVVVGMVFALILFRTTSEHWAPTMMRQWDLLLPFIIYFGQRRRLAEGLILALFTSHLFSLSSAAPIGVFTAGYLVIFLVARLLSYVIYADTWFSITLLIAGMAVLNRMAITAIAAAFGHGWPIFSSETFVVWGIFLNAAVGCFFYLLVEGVDRLTFKVPPSNIELSESDV